MVEAGVVDGRKVEVQWEEVKRGDQATACDVGNRSLDQVAADWTLHIIPSSLCPH